MEMELLISLRGERLTLPSPSGEGKRAAAHDEYLTWAIENPVT
jgi:hypothetical protein